MSELTRSGHHQGSQAHGSQVRSDAWRATTARAEDAGIAAPLDGLTLRWVLGVGHSEDGRKPAFAEMRIESAGPRGCRAVITGAGSITDSLERRQVECAVVEDRENAILHVNAGGVAVIAVDNNGRAVGAGQRVDDRALRSTILYARGPFVDEARELAGAPAGSAELIAAWRD